MEPQHPNMGGRQPRRGLTAATETEFASRTIEIRRVSRMVAGGRRFRFRALVAVGNGKGVVGMGIGKGVDVQRAVEKATRRARAACVTIPLKGGTIPREVRVKQGTARLLLRPARPGHGIVAGGVVRAFCELAGIQDLSAKILSRSTNSLANAQVAMKAFRLLAERVGVAELRKQARPKSAESE